MNELLTMLVEESSLMSLGLDCREEHIPSPDEVQEAIETLDNLARKYGVAERTETHSYY